MKISPISSAVNTVQSTPEGAPKGGMVERMRSLKMSTNATPGYNASLPAASELSIPDNIEANATVEATQPISPHFAALAKQRRALQQERRAFEDEKKALLSQSQGSEKIDLARLKSEPLSVLLEAGVSYDQLTEAILAGQGNSEINSLKAEIAALKEGVDKKFVDKETQAEQQVLAEMRREASLLASSGEAFELVRETRSIPDVMKLIEQTYRQSGEILEVKDALQLVEDELFKDAQKLAGLKKVQNQFAPAPEPQQRPQGMRTITNKDTASVPLSAKARALAAFYGTLKK